ncbi:MAG: hypothetical protein JRJ16_17955 [Deltaproteobacteria bacterium]|nr:hypothetical protein [Deltaproteobacteria bacterium]
MIGLESASDYSLGRVNKGYEYKDVLEAVERIIAHLDRRLFLEISIILDLPARNAADVRENYRRIAGIQDRLLEAGFRVGVHMNILSPFPNMDLLRPEEGLYRTPGDPGEWDLSCGKTTPCAGPLTGTWGPGCRWCVWTKRERCCPRTSSWPKRT